MEPDTAKSDGGKPKERVFESSSAIAPAKGCALAQRNYELV
jgi:hypothetical protein